MKKSGVVAIAFGIPWSIRSNCQIAEISFSKAESIQAEGMPVEVYTQRVVVIPVGVPVVYITEQLGDPIPSTLKMAREGVAWAHREGIAELWVAAAKPHLWRARRDLRRAVEEQGVSIEILECEEIEKYPARSWFCSDSGQMWTKSAWAWYPRELFLRILPFSVYRRVVAS